MRKPSLEICIPIPKDVARKKSTDRHNRSQLTTQSEDPGAVVRQESECTLDLQVVLHDLRETLRVGKPGKWGEMGATPSEMKTGFLRPSGKVYPLPIWLSMTTLVSMIQLLQDELNT